MTTDAKVTFNPFDPEFRKNPYPTYHRLLVEDPVQESPFGGLVLSRYADCTALLRDSRASSEPFTMRAPCHAATPSANLPCSSVFTRSASRSLRAR